ncbi:MAG TPA: menaquinone biosynthesis protein [Desulfuromonadales bacterium]|nr:menaquinone biosynthesis protein [Desulfuromonadales bacterium]
MLRIGQIEYANCTPLFYVLRERFPCSGYEFVPGVPSDLNNRLALGQIDVCPCSSIEFARHASEYRILPQLSISCNGPVASVLLFSRCPIEELQGTTILLSSESATSVNLLKILMQQRYGCKCRYLVTRRTTGDALDVDSPAILLIGDAALRASLRESDGYVYDLGALWHDWTGLPFVFALWLCRQEVAETKELKIVSRQLIQAKELVSSYSTEIAEKVNEADWMGRERLLLYWRDNISYQLDERNIVGLTLFYEKCHQIGLLPDVPELRFTTE